jgi:hypothetical protein
MNGNINFENNEKYINYIIDVIEKGFCTFKCIGLAFEPDEGQKNNGDSKTGKQENSILFQLLH